jgi:cytoskeletal protein CcmA (bactofilin family)
MWNQEDARQNKMGSPLPVEVPSASRKSDGVDVKAVQFGRSICIKGDVTGSEDLTVDGQVEGRIELPQHALTVGPNAMIHADITAKSVTVFGTVMGSVTAHERLDIRKSGSVEGNVICSLLAVQEGAVLGGKIETRGGRSNARIEPSKQALAPVA